MTCIKEMFYDGVTAEPCGLSPRNTVHHNKRQFHYHAYVAPVEKEVTNKVHMTVRELIAALHYQNLDAELHFCLSKRDLAAYPAEKVFVVHDVYPEDDSGVVNIRVEEF